MSELIKFHIVPGKEKEAAKRVKRSNKMVFSSVLIALLVIGLGVFGYLYLVERDPGAVEEKPPKIAQAKDTTKTTQPQDTVKKTVEGPQAAAGQDNVKIVTDYLLVNREGYSKYLKAVIARNIDLQLLVSGKEGMILFEGICPSEAVFDRQMSQILEEGGGREFALIWADSAKSFDFIVRGFLPVLPEPPPLKLDPVPPYLRGPTIAMLDSISRHRE
jgi:hypothetical protein